MPTDYEEVVAEPVALAPMAAEEVAAELVEVKAEIAEDYGAVVTEPVALGSAAAEQVGAEPVEDKAVAISIAAALGALPSLTPSEAKKSDAEFDLSLGR